ncbi:MAG TPA: ThuA domain-containing protein [Casimicrobiaceae bacterium]|nr:ThuA domain-containing protein [Casimicrobiaceae bacterium]
MMRNLLLSGGPTHAFDQTTPRVVRMLAAPGFKTTVFEDIEEGVGYLARERFALLTVHCLRWSMVQTEKYAPLRASWGFSLSEAARAAIVAHLSRGGGVLGLHTAAISFDTWPKWRDCLGAAWTWGVSNHKPLGPVDVSIAESDHPVTRGVHGFSCEDEAYANMDLSPRAIVLANARAREDDVAHPSVIVQEDEMRGRSVYLALGHGPSTFDHPAFERLVQQAAAWCVTRSSA